MRNEDIKLYKESKSFLTVHKKYDINKLPSWIKNDIKNARVYGKDNKCIIMPDGNKYHLDNKLNDMNGKEWTFFINSVFSTRYPTNGKESYAHNIRKIHPTPKPPQLMRDIIKFFTKENELVFDCFCGVGGTLLGASLCNRDAIGIDLNKEYISAYKKASKKLNLKIQKTICANSITYTCNKNRMNKLIGDKYIKLMLIDPPYFNMMSRNKTGGDIDKYGKTSTPFTNNKNDLGNMTKEDFFVNLNRIISNTLPYIEDRGYIVVFIKDLQPNKKELNMLHYDIANCLNQIPNIYYKGMKIWSDESTKLYPYGYPFCFVANQIHQYIMIFQKRNYK